VAFENAAIMLRAVDGLASEQESASDTRVNFEGFKRGAQAVLIESGIAGGNLGKNTAEILADYEQLSKARAEARSVDWAERSQTSQQVDAGILGFKSLTEARKCQESLGVPVEWSTK
jgi:hypothetical protein